MKINQVIKKFAPFIPISLVVLASIFVAISTYQSGTILSGWDTLHPEFNLKLYANRIFWGAWQEHQGLGAAAAQAHLAELPRLPFIWLLNTIFGTNLVRYIFILTMYVIGGITSYWYIKYVWFEQETNKNSYRLAKFWEFGKLWQYLQGTNNPQRDIQTSIAAALGSLLYLFNLGTLQHFQVPLEMFAVHFATFGLVLGSFHLFLKNGEKKFAIFMFISQILAAPAAHTATLFYVYTGILFGYGVLFAILNKDKTRNHLKCLIISILLVISANAFWMGPNLYYIVSHSKETQEAKINRNFSDEAFWQNQAFGEVKNVVIFKNFLFNWKIYDFEKQESIDMFEDWSSNLTKVEKVWPYFLGFIFLSGIMLSFGAKRKEKLPLLIIFLTGFLFLNNLNPPSTLLYKIVIAFSSTLEEALRFPFTKFSIIFIFAASVYLAEFTNFLFKKIMKTKTSSKNRLGAFTKLAPLFVRLGIFENKSIEKFRSKLKIGLILLTTGLLAFGILYPMEPLFTGKLISEKVKVQIPEEYFEMFEWFETQPNDQKIAMFPILNFWQWSYYDWSTENYASGYQGGGFLWFGLPQPLLNREFDRWAMQNEFFYHEINHAVEANDEEQFSQILEKYDVSWLLYDKNIIDLPQKDKNYEKYYFKFIELISKNKNISLKKTFKNIDIYSISKNHETNLQKVGSEQERVVEDIVYKKYGQYISEPSFNDNYLFSEVFDETLNNLVNVSSGDWKIKNNIIGYDKLAFPEWDKTNSYLPVEIIGTVNGDKIVLTIKSLLPNIEISGNSYQLSDFADKDQIITEENLSFIDDDYYYINIGKQISTLDPNKSLNQELGVILLNPNENLELEISGSYDRRAQKIIVSKEKIDSLFPKQREFTLNGGEGEVSVIYKESLANKLIRKVNSNQTFVEENCTKQGEISFKQSQNSRIFRATNGGDGCSGYLLNNLFSTEGYLLNFEVENISGPNFYALINEAGQNPFFQETFEKENNNITLAIFPKNDNDLSLIIHNRSFGSYPTENILKNINLLPLPFEYISNIVARKSPVLDSQNENLKIITVVEPKQSTWWSLRRKNQTEPGIILLKESHDKGWLAISLSKPFSTLPHYKYNSWANAWKVDAEDQYIIVFFWPQLLVWLGFGSMLGTVVLLIRYNSPKKKIKPSFNLKKIQAVFYEKKV